MTLLCILIPLRCNLLIVVESFSSNFTLTFPKLTIQERIEMREKLVQITHREGGKEKLVVFL